MKFGGKVLGWLDRRHREQKSLSLLFNFFGKMFLPVEIT